MSVINQMLKDLEKRQQPVEAEPEGRMKPPSLDYHQPAKSTAKIWLWALLGLVAGCGLTYGVIAWQKLAVEPSPAAKSLASYPKVQAKVNENLDIAAEPIVSQVQDSSWESSDTATNERSSDMLVADEPKLLAPKDKPLPGPKPEPKEDIGFASTQEQVDVTQAPDGVPAKVNKEIIEPIAKPIQSSSTHTSKKSESREPRIQITPVVLTKAQLVAKKMQQAKVLESEGSLGQAIALYSELLEQDASLHSARKKLAALLYGQSRYGQAIQVLGQGVALYPDYQEYFLLLARVSLDTNNLTQAMASLEQMKSSGPYAKQKWIQISDLAQKLKDYPKAENAFRQLARLEPGQGRWWMGLGYALDSQSDFTQALVAYRNAIDNQNLSPKAREFVENRIQVLGDYQ